MIYFGGRTDRFGFRLDNWDMREREKEKNQHKNQT